MKNEVLQKDMAHGRVLCTYVTHAGLLGKPRTDLREFCSAPNFQEIPCAMSTVTIYTAKHLKFQNIEYEHVDQCVG